jgi:nucleoside-diphosphate-sugar epimerase
LKAIVTGGAGFIGSHLVRRLLEDGAEVTVIDDLSTGRRENLAGCDVRLAERDLTADPVDDLLRGADVVFHLAAMPSVPRSVKEPLRSHEAAATATLKLLIAARDRDVPAFINSSSSSVYGNVAQPPMRESMPTLPRSPYAVAKLAAEGYTRVFASLYGMRTVSLRYFNVFGPRQDPKSAYAAAVPRFISAYLQHVRPTVFDDGLQSRDFTYVNNVVHANVLAARTSSLGGESINVAAGEPRTVLDLLREIASAFGHTLEPEFVPARAGDIRDSHADITRARELIAYSPVASFGVGLAETIDWLRGSDRRGGAQ